MLAIAIVLALAGPAWAEAETEGDGEAEAAAEQTPDKSARTTGSCIDKEIADRLAVKRRRRGAVDRLFVKQARHEFMIGGGYYVSDLFSSTYAVGANYTYHMTESTAVELGYWYTHANADVIESIEAQRGEVIEDDYASVSFYESLLVLTPVYGKLRLGGTVARFDIHVDAGVGVVDSQTSRGIAGVGGLGFKLFLGRAVALRIDARDHVFQQELLEERFLVNDVSVTAGVSLFLPFGN